MKANKINKNQLEAHLKAIREGDSTSADKLLIQLGYSIQEIEQKSCDLFYNQIKNSIENNIRAKRTNEENHMVELQN